MGGPLVLELFVLLLLEGLLELLELQRGLVDVLLDLLHAILLLKNLLLEMLLDFLEG